MFNTPNDPNNGTLPTSIVLDGKEYSIKDTPELSSLMLQIQAVTAQKEKTKLYDTISAFKKNNEDLSKKVNDLTTELTRIAFTTPNNGQPTPQPNPTEPGNQAYVGPDGKTIKKDDGTALTKNDVALMLSDAFNKQLPDILKAQLVPLYDKVGSLEQATVQEYRNKQLALLGDAVIPELVKGNTKEEIDSSIAIAKEIRLKYAPPTPTPQPVPQPTQNPTPTTQTAANPVAPVIPQPEPTPTALPRPGRTNLPPDRGPVLEGVKNMDMNDFAKNRDKMLAELANQVNQ